MTPLSPAIEALKAARERLRADRARLRRSALNKVASSLQIGRWLTFREVTIDITCPRCGFTDPVIPSPPEPKP